jgi:hypothetical protein
MEVTPSGDRAMIRYDLRCARGHGFDAWFRDSAAFDAQAAAGLVACAVCGSPQVEKQLMAPALRTGAAAPEPPDAGAAAPALPALSAPPASPAAAALAALRRRVEETAEYVGPRFAAEARRLHETGESDRAIWGEATRAEAESLVEDGVPVAPLPWLPPRND